MVLFSGLLVWGDFSPARLFETTGNDIKSLSLIENSIGRGVVCSWNARKCTIFGEGNIICMPSSWEVLVPIKWIWLGKLANVYSIITLKNVLSTRAQH
jgi:hypothetical protein